ncbi:hypothetical protein SEA_CASSITA_125 [Microbacterium phage Cassita]|nr:hypothetical protein SEA_CASSITA_125 [Microbacterium phage Cassita]
MAFDWVIVQDNGVSDRFESREDAAAVISEYPGGTIEYFPEWWN